MTDSMKLVANPVATIGEMLYDSLDNQLGREVELRLCPICAQADGKRVALVNCECPVCHSDFRGLAFRTVPMNWIVIALTALITFVLSVAVCLVASVEIARVFDLNTRR